MKKAVGPRSAWMSLISLLLALGAEPATASPRPLPHWVTEKPSPATQIQRSIAERGVNPCMTPDPGFGNFSTWDRAPLLGQAIVAKDIERANTFDVVVHFHGHEAGRKALVEHVEGGIVFVGIDLGTGSGAYLDRFADPSLFEKLLISIETAVRKREGNDRLTIRKVGITSWSAGYGAVLRILSTPYGKRRVDALALLDGLHTGYEGSSLSEKKLEPIVDFALRAKRSEKLLYVSHSSIIPPGYASTTETANYLVYKVGGRPEHPKDQRKFPLGLQLISTYSAGQFTVRGFEGNGTLDHCAHFGLLGQVVRGRFQSRWGKN